MKKIIAITSVVFLAAGCSNMSNTEQRTLSGASIGAAAGAVGTAILQSGAHRGPGWHTGPDGRRSGARSAARARCPRRGQQPACTRGTTRRASR